MRGATQYFVCQIPKFLVEICISTRQDMVFTQDVARGIYTRWNCDISMRRGRAH